MSRDWVIDKLELTVPYDTDLALLKKVVKQIGKELAADPELTHVILQPLKMQGVETMGEIGMLVRLKMMTKPGEQFVVRRRPMPCSSSSLPRTASGSQHRPCRWRTATRAPPQPPR